MFTKLAIVGLLLVSAQASHDILQTVSHGESWNNVNLRSGKPVKVVALVGGHGGWGGNIGGGGGIGIGLGHGGLGLGLGHGGGLRLGGGLGHGGIGIGLGGGHEEIVDYLAPAKYAYKYGVIDGHTGDKKEQEEVRDGDVVKGQYSVAEPDGTLRIVKYVADDKRGFNAQVIRQGHAIHPKVLTEVINPVNIRVGHGLGGGLGGGWGGSHGGDW